MKISAIRPWIIQVPWSERQGGEGPFLTSDNKRELLYTQIDTDEGITGWGEVTTTHPVANRAVCAILRDLSPRIVGDDPIQIEKIWNKIFRRFTYMGSRGATTNAISGIIVIGAILHLAQAENLAVGIMAFFAVLIASINVGGGFRVTHRMLKMFRK